MLSQKIVFFQQKNKATILMKSAWVHIRDAEGINNESDGFPIGKLKNWIANKSQESHRVANCTASFSIFAFLLILFIFSFSRPQSPCRQSPSPNWRYAAWLYNYTISDLQREFWKASTPSLSYLIMCYVFFSLFSI